jgi:phosphoglycolate phosphatase
MINRIARFFQPRVRATRQMGNRMAVDAKPDAVLFDFDGTLFDTAPDIIAALNRVLAELGRAGVDHSNYRNLAGDGAKHLLLRATASQGVVLDKAEVEPLVQRLIAYYYEMLTERTQPFPGVAHTLERFFNDTATTEIYTNRPAVSTTALLDHFDMAAHFGAVICGDEVQAKKPDPLHIAEALDRLGATHERAVMVGDTATDVKAARAAGIPVVAVAYGYSLVPPISGSRVGA